MEGYHHKTLNEGESTFSSHLIMSPFSSHYHHCNIHHHHSPLSLPLRMSWRLKVTIVGPAHCPLLNCPTAQEAHCLAHCTVTALHCPAQLHNCLTAKLPTVQALHCSPTAQLPNRVCSTTIHSQILQLSSRASLSVRILIFWRNVIRLTEPRISVFCYLF